MDRLSSDSLERSTTDDIDGGAGCLNDNGRPILKPLEGVFGLSGSSRPIVKALLGSSPRNNNGRSNIKSPFGGASSTIRALLWGLLLGWGFSALIFSLVYVGFLGSSRITINYVANFSGDGEATFQNSRVASLGGHPAEVLKYLQETQEMQQRQLIVDGTENRNLSEHCKYPSELSYVHVLDCAAKTGQEDELQTQALGAVAPPRRVAFLFLARGKLPLEPVWRRFLAGHEEFYSVYVHTDPKFTFQNDSFFYGHQVPSEPAERFSITLVDAVRRLLANAILDPVHGATNSWFVLACEATLPIRSFNFTYNYLMESQHSFVESFRPGNMAIQWFDRAKEEPIARDQLRKGEMWWAIERRHAFMIIEDWSLYYTYKRLCRFWCAPDEQYVPTLLAMRDRDGIENRTAVYVNWFEHHGSSPYLHFSNDLTVDWFEDIRGRTIDRDGQYHDTSLVAMGMGWKPNATRSCYYNGVADSACFLFARKVSGDATQHLMSLPESILGY